MVLEPDMDGLRALTGIKWTRFDADVIPAWVADMDFPTAPAITRALRELVDRSDLGYSFAEVERIPEVWADWSERRHAWRPDVERVRVFSNVLQPIAATLHVATEPGDGVVVFTPVYPVFFDLIAGAGRRVVECELDSEGWTFDAGRLDAVVDDTTRVILSCSPHNPTGRVLDETELEAVAEVAEARDLVVVGDEIWQDLVYEDAPRRHRPFASLGGKAAERAVTVTAASKTFGLGGLSCAVGHLGDERVREGIEALPPKMLGGIDRLGAQATLVAWTEGEEWLAEVLEALRANRDHLARRLAVELPDAGFDVPESTYLAWLDLREYQSGPDPAEHLLREARVGLSSGPRFGGSGEGFARLNFATPTAVLDEIVDRIVAAMT